jgi:hypothetical protein
MTSLPRMSSPTNIRKPIPPQSPTYDPLERFPYEIWQDCFRLAISDAADGPLPYLAVSTKWNETILHDPSFWTTIIIDDGEDQDARIYTFLCLSKTLLLDVETWGFDGFPGIIEGCSSRIRSITQCTSRSDRPLSQFLAEWPKSGHTPSFPELKTLIGLDRSTLSRDFLLACPKLSIVRWVEVEIADEPYLPSTMKEVSFTRVDPCRLSKIIHRTNIQSLGLTYPPWPPLDEAEIAGWRTALRSVAISLSPQLQSLHMVLSLEFFWEFISILPEFSQLSSLELWFRSTPMATRDAYIPPLHVQHLKALTLHFNFDDTDITESGKLALNATNAVLHSFVKECPLKNLEDLQIISRTSFNGSLLGSLFQSTVNVKSISLWIQDHHNPDIPSTNHMPTLETLTLYTPDLLPYFNPPNLMELRIVERSGALTPRPSPINLGPEIIKLDVPGWIFDVNNAPSSPETFTLKHRYITLTSSISPGVINRLAFLEEISFNTDSDEREVGNGFLMEILRNKGSCPRLHTILFQEFPLWEPLFEVMRRRMNDNIQRITRLKFPGPPHIYILRRLVQLLDGASNVYTTRNVDEIISRRRSCGYL